MNIEELYEKMSEILGDYTGQEPLQEMLEKMAWVISGDWGGSMADSRAIVETAFRLGAASVNEALSALAKQANDLEEQRDRNAELALAARAEVSLLNRLCEQSDRDDYLAEQEQRKLAHEHAAAIAEVERLTGENRRLRLQYADACAALRETRGGPWAR